MQIVFLNLWQNMKEGEDLSHSDLLQVSQKTLDLMVSSFSDLSSFRRYRYKDSLSSECQSLVKGFRPANFFLVIILV